jgi:DNA-nicking Smr family endonuclease
MSGSRKPHDVDLFAAVFRDVKPLRRSKISPHHAASSDETRPSKPLPRGEVARESVRVRGPSSPAPPAPNPGIDRRTAERLRKGAMEIDRRIDLHGLTESDAHAALDRFVRQAWRDQVRVLLVITGKGSVGQGGGVLRRNLPRWLAIGEHARRVLRIESAQPRHGGSGAYYVLLRRHRERGGE